MPIIDEEIAEDENVINETVSTEDELELLAPYFKKDLRWIFDDAGDKIHCLIEDENFLNKVEARMEKFAKGDLFIVDRVIRKIRKNDGKTKKEHTITKVHKINPPKQIPMNL